MRFSHKASIVLYRRTKWKQVIHDMASPLEMNSTTDEESLLNVLFDYRSWFSPHNIYTHTDAHTQMQRDRYTNFIIQTWSYTLQPVTDRQIDTYIHSYINRQTGVIFDDRPGPDNLCLTLVDGILTEISWMMKEKRCYAIFLEKKKARWRCWHLFGTEQKSHCELVWSTHHELGSSMTKQVRRDIK